MNNLFPELSSNLLLSLPGFRLYALCAIVLVIKMQAVGIATARTRARLKVALNAEDAARFGAQLVNAEHPEVERVLRAHRNDLENIPVFLILGFIAVLAGAPPLGLQICLIAFTAARVVHSIAYVKAMQPWRSLSFGIGGLCSLALSVMIILRLVS
ncbi:MAPEG family protein [Vitiosangium sp. GDMCC 1.1324]|uniref:MAPEG family protein n=1 Tax=Vitiosangium sp. (strain GDMCC 1.1324) TaxID=2138576 RepID=UPI00130EA827|nr:MAPEG family protein [Vitiosangium sp. GDMCC 1.1324]